MSIADRNKAITFQAITSDGRKFAQSFADEVIGTRKRLLAVLLDPSDEMLDAGLAATAAHLNIQGSALTVNREKMRRRFVAMIRYAMEHEPS